MSDLGDIGRMFHQLEQELSKVGSKPKTPQKTGWEKAGAVVGVLSAVLVMTSLAALIVSGTIWLILHMF